MIFYLWPPPAFGENAAQITGWRLHVKHPSWAVKERNLNWSYLLDLFCWIEWEWGVTGREDLPRRHSSPLGGAHPEGLNAGPASDLLVARGKPPPLLPVMHCQQPSKENKTAECPCWPGE
ncbi:MAG: hypothetical protein C7N36_17705, partial [Bacteroidetes bacterium]